MAISQDPICGTEQNGKAYWRKVTQEFHERRQHAPFKIHSDWPIVDPKEMEFHPINKRPANFVVRMSSTIK
jgi:hypothetical protein